MHKIVFSLMVVFCIGLVSALDDSQVPYIAEQYSTYDVKVPCSINGAYCFPTVACNISIVNPDSTFLVNNKRMTLTGSVVNYTLLGTQTANDGRYLMNVMCSDPLTGLNATTDGLIIITPTGKYENTSSNIWLFVIALVFSAGLILLGFSKNDAWTALFGGLLLTVLGGYILLNGIGLYHNEVTNAIAIVSMMFSLYISLRAGLEVIDENFK